MATPEKDTERGRRGERGDTHRYRGQADRQTHTHGRDRYKKNAKRARQKDRKIPHLKRETELVKSNH